MTTTEITTLPSNGDVEKWSEAERAIADAAGLVFTHTYGAKEGQREPAPRAVVEKFLHVARKTGLDPLTRQLYCIGRLSGSRVEWAIQTSIDGFRVIAERSQKYAGQDAVQWMTEKGDWVDAFVPKLHGKHPLAARVAVHRTDWPNRPAVGIAVWDEYVQTKRNGEPTQMWLKMGALMLAKCAEALALRRAFPQDLSGLYTGDEMLQATVVDEGETPRQAVARANAEQPSAPAAAPQGDDEGVIEGELVDDAPTPQSAPERVSEQPIAPQQSEGKRDWRADADAAPNADAVLQLFNECRDAGELGLLTEVANEQSGEVEPMQLRVYLRKLGERLRQIEEQGGEQGAPAVLAPDEHTKGGSY